MERHSISCKSCEFLVTEWEGGQVNAGKITLGDGKLKAHPTKGHESVLKEVMGNKSYKGKKEFDPKEDPEGWLESLPYQYSGSVFRARLVDK